MAVLTISREYGSGGKEIGRAIAEELGYGYVNRGKILEDIKKVGSDWEEHAKYFDENEPTVQERYKWSYRGFVALNQYHILKHGLRGNVVIMGRGGHQLLKGIPYVLRIRTQAPLKKRIEKVMKWEEINSETAQWLIEKADREMAGAVYVIYGSKWDDPQEYDRIFDTGSQTQEEIVRILKEELLKRDKLVTAEFRKVLELRTLAAKIKAEIAIDSNFFISMLDVRPKEEGLVEYGLVLQGVVRNREDIKRIEDFAREIAGEVPLESKLLFRWHSRLGPMQFGS